MRGKNKAVTKLIVPLAGFGTRFAPSSMAYPKELTHLVDKTVLQYVVEEAVESGIREVIFILNSSKESIRKYFSQTYQDEYVRKAFPKGTAIPKDLAKLHELIKKVKFRYIVKQSTLGDGHSVLLARRFIGKEESFAVGMGDLLSFGGEPFLKQIIDVYRIENTPVISVEKISLDETSKFGVIAPRASRGRTHEVEDIVEKPGPAKAPSTFAMTGRYVLTPAVFEILGSLVKKHKKGEVKLAEALKAYAKKDRLLAYECRGSIQDTGNKLDFLKAAVRFGLRSPVYGTPLKKFIKSLRM
ncbi:UTP--glucose-1-phosphate uridylyltransferase [Candidatus Parcubacteria bacterium]|nr:UTP--glucose-1-phosphate uridylyltransferase [Candidatus Parcubacteria bacterium]